MSLPSMFHIPLFALHNTLPYAPRMDDAVAVVLFGCFFVSAYVLAHSRKFLGLLAKGFVLHRNRPSLFAESTASDIRRLSLLILQTCVLCGVCMLCVHTRLRPELAETLPSALLLTVYVLVCIAYLALKWLLSMGLCYLFFDEERTSLWLESYSTLLYYLGFALFPLVLLTVYFDLSLTVTVVVAAVMFAVFELSVIFKWVKLFSPHIDGSLALILYFCALEITPVLVVHKAVMQLNDCLLPVWEGLQAM